MIKKLTLSLLVLFVPSVSRAFSPVRYVQISTNTLTRQTGTGVVAGMDISTATVSSGTITGLNGSTVTYSSGTYTNLNANSYNFKGDQGYLLLYSSTAYDQSGSSSTTSASYVPTKTAITLTPHSTTSRIELSVSGCLETSNGNAVNALATLERGSTDLSPNGKAFCISDVAVAGVARVGCSFDIIDTPSSIAATTYTVNVRNDSAGTTVTWNTSQNCISQITAKEWSY